MVGLRNMPDRRRTVAIGVVRSQAEGRPGFQPKIAQQTRIKIRYGVILFTVAAWGSSTPLMNGALVPPWIEGPPVVLHQNDKDRFDGRPFRPREQEGSATKPLPPLQYLFLQVAHNVWTVADDAPPQSVGYPNCLLCGASTVSVNCICHMPPLGAAPGALFSSPLGCWKRKKAAPG